MRYFHGSFAQLGVGDVLLPPSVTSCRNCSDYLGRTTHDKNYVYVTTYWLEACLYAVTRFDELRGWRKFAGRGYIYEVDPVGKLERDPEYEDFPESWQVCMFRGTAAKVIAVYRPNWSVTILRALQQLYMSLFGLEVTVGWCYAYAEWKIKRRKHV